MADFFGGGAKEYFTFNYADERGAIFADDTPMAGIAYMQIHYFCPLKKDQVELKKRIKKALFEAGFTYPSITELPEADSKDPDGGVQHLIFECAIDYETEL